MGGVVIKDDVYINILFQGSRGIRRSADQPRRKKLFFLKKNSLLFFFFYRSGRREGVWFDVLRILGLGRPGGGVGGP